MPELTDLELAEHARAIDPDLGVIVVAAYGAEDTVAFVLGLGLSSFLAKPIERDRLARAVQRAFLKRSGDEYHREMVKSMYAALARNADKIREVTLGTLSYLINAVDARSPHFRGHS